MMAGLFPVGSAVAHPFEELNRALQLSRMALKDLPLLWGGGVKARRFRSQLMVVARCHSAPRSSL
jgi:hypothetical protein